MTVEISIPTEFQRVATTLISQLNGMITACDADETDWVTITAEISLNEMFGFAGTLRSKTQVN